MSGYADAGILCETEWLADRLGDPSLRILDCTVFLHPRREGDMRAESGRAAYDAAHIPGAVFADLISELSDPASALRFTLPSAERFAAAISGYGLGEGTTAVLYATSTPIWAARLWWMLRAFGFDNAMVLNGGWKKWLAEGRPVSTEPGAYPPARFVAKPRPGLFVGREEVKAAMGDAKVRLIKALSPEQHAGTGGTNYGRPGRIPGSVNVPARNLLDPATDTYLPVESLRQAFAAAGVSDGERIITYCGGGIAASGDALALALLGVTDVAVYDASLQEWAKDPALPMETG